MNHGGDDDMLDEAIHEDEQFLAEQLAELEAVHATYPGGTTGAECGGSIKTRVGVICQHCLDCGGGCRSRKQCFDARAAGAQCVPSAA